MSLARERAARKQWSAPTYVLLWLTWEGGFPRVKLAVEHVPPDDASRLDGWVEDSPGCWQKTVALSDLAHEMETVGRMFEETTA